MDLFRWNEANLPDTFRTKFHPEMLNEDGYAIKRTVGDRRNSATTRAYVIFNRDYVLESLKRQFKLLGITKHDAIELVNGIEFDDDVIITNYEYINTDGERDYAELADFTPEDEHREHEELRTYD